MNSRDFFCMIRLIIVGLILSTNTVKAEPLIVDHSFCGQWQAVPDSVIQSIQDNNYIYYVHTSHGSQILRGIVKANLTDSRFPNVYNWPGTIFSEVEDDLGTNGDTTWAPGTRNFLNAHPECNMVMYSWCGGVSINSEAGINIYLDKVSELENDYPDVKFVYMTGHLDGTGETGNLYVRNNQIRAYCQANDKILFDFADIESFDPDGNYYPNASDSCEWCYTWCSDPGNDCIDDCTCAHSHCFNCFQKAKAWWVMMAIINGWNLTSVNDDTSTLPGNIAISQNYPNPFNNSTIITYQVKHSAQVTLNIYDALGRLIANIVDEKKDEGIYKIEWNASNYSSGIYFFSIAIGDVKETKAMVFLK